jgi:hypothetical protein
MNLLLFSFAASFHHGLSTGFLGDNPEFRMAGAIFKFLIEPACHPSK